MLEPAAACARLSRVANGPPAIFVGRGIYAATQFALLAAVGRCCGTEAVGDVVLGLAVAVPLFALFGGQLRLVQATDPDRRIAFQDAERIGLIGHGIGLLLFMAIVCALRSEIAGAATLLGVGCARAGESWSDVAYGALQRQRRFAAIGVSTALKSLAGSAVAILVLSLSHSPGAAFAANAIVWLTGSVFIDRALANRRAKRTLTECDSSAELLRRSLPLSAGATISTFDTQTPRFFVDAFLGSRALGLFGVTHYAALSILTLIVPLTFAWTPALAVDVARGDREAFRQGRRRAVGIAAALGAFATLIALPAGPILAAAFSEPRLAEGWTFTFAMCAAGVLAPAAALETIVRAAHGFRLLCTLQIASLILHLGACATGLTWFGLEGVAGGMLVRSIAYLAMLAVGSYFAEKAAFATPATIAPSAVPLHSSGAASRRRAA